MKLNEATIYFFFLFKKKRVNCSFINLLNNDRKVDNPDNWKL